MSDSLSQEQIDRLLAPGDPGYPIFPRERYQHIRPLADAAESYIEYLANPASRFMLGLPAIDTMTRGFGKGELIYITGRAHSAKTQIVLNAISHQNEKNIVFFTPDETAELVLAKLIAIHHDMAGAELEDRVKARDPETLELVRRAAKEDFANLIVLDRSMRFNEMTQAVEEARDYFGADLDAVVIDFLELLPGSADGGMEGVAAKSQKLKRWTKELDVPCLTLHQSSRGSGARGKSGGMDAMKYGGETEAMFVLEAWRKREDTTLDPWEAQRHQHTVTVGLWKNKRSGAGSVRTGEHDFYLDPRNGLIRELRDGDEGVFRPKQQESLGDRMREW